MSKKIAKKERIKSNILNIKIEYYKGNKTNTTITNSAVKTTIDQGKIKTTLLTGEKDAH